MVEATHLGEDERRDTAPRRFLQWMQLPVACAAITAVTSHALLTLFVSSPAKSSVSLDAIASALAVFVLCAMIAYRTMKSARKN